MSQQPAALLFPLGLQNRKYSSFLVTSPTKHGTLKMERKSSSSPSNGEFVWAKRAFVPKGKTRAICCPLCATQIWPPAQTIVVRLCLKWRCLSFVCAIGHPFISAIGPSCPAVPKILLLPLLANFDHCPNAFHVCQMQRTIAGGWFWWDTGRIGQK